MHLPEWIVRSPLAHRLFSELYNGQRLGYTLGLGAFPQGNNINFSPEQSVVLINFWDLFHHYWSVSSFIQQFPERNLEIILEHLRQILLANSLQHCYFLSLQTVHREWGNYLVSQLFLKLYHEGHWTKSQEFRVLESLSSCVSLNKSPNWYGSQITSLYKEDNNHLLHRVVERIRRDICI